jgi:hypothetical protein
MRESRTTVDEKGSETRTHKDPTSGRRPSPLGWTLVAGAIAALVYIPAVLTGEQDPWQEGSPLGPTPTETPVFVFEPLDSIPVNGAFAGTVGYGESSPTGVDLHVVIGANAGTGNTYRLATTEDVPAGYGVVGSNPVVRLRIPAGSPFSVGPTIPPLNGACCAADQGIVDGGQFHTTLTTPGFNTQEALILLTGTNATSLVDFPGNPHLSSWLDLMANGDLVASTYNTSAGEVQIFTRPVVGTWTPLADVPMDSPITNSHWAQASDPDGGKVFIMGRDGGPVLIRQIDAATGNTDWSTQVDFQSTFPSAFRYFQVDWAGLVNLPGGGTGNGLAFLSPSDTELKGGIVAPVGGPSPPTYLQLLTFPGAVADRQAFSSDGGMIYVHYPDPDGSGVITSVINCNGLAGPCTHTTMEDDSRDIIWSGFASDSMLGQGGYFRVLFDRMVIVEGTGTNAVDVWAADLPQVIHNHESGELQWNNVVGGVPEGP